MTIKYPLLINALLLIKYWQGNMLWLGQVHYEEEILTSLLLYIYINIHIFYISYVFHETTISDSIVDDNGRLFIYMKALFELIKDIPTKTV